MAVTFLRGPVISLGPVDDAAGVEAMAWTLARAARSTREREQEAGPDRVIGLAVLDAASGDARVGLVSLEDVDWVAREARVTHRGARMGEALALVTRYAFDELGLARLVAVPADAAAERALAAASFRASAGGHWERTGSAWHGSGHRP